MFLKKIQLKKGNLDGTWADFDAKKAPKRLPNGIKNRSKID